MPSTTPARARRGLRSVLAGAAALVTAASLLVAAPAAPAEASFEGTPSWIGGKDLYETSALMSRQQAPSTSVYLTSGEAGGDALAAPPAAIAAGAHLLMVRRDSVPPAIEQRLRELQPRFINIVGSRAVLSDRLWADVRRILPNVKIYRVGSNAGDRVDSALRLMFNIRNSGGVLDEVFVIGRNGYSDGLAAGNVAARIGGAIVPAMGDPAAWAQRVLAELRRARAVYFVGARGVLPQSYFAALDAVLPSHIGMDRLAGPDRYATNAALIDRFVPGISARQGYLIAGNGHGDTVGASVLAARQDSVMLLSGRTCHDHTAVPEQLDRLQVDRIVGIGTKFWIAESALRMRLCDGSTYRSQHGPDPSMPQLEPVETAPDAGWLQRRAGQMLGTFRGGTLSGGAGHHQVQLPANAYWGVLRATHAMVGSGDFAVTAHSSRTDLTETVVADTGDAFDGSGLIAPIDMAYAPEWLEIDAEGPWTILAQDLRYAYSGAFHGTDSHVGLVGGDWGRTLVNEPRGSHLTVRQVGFWSGLGPTLQARPGESRSVALLQEPMIMQIVQDGAPDDGWALQLR